MNELLGLAGLNISGPVEETASMVRVHVEANPAPACGRCSGRDLKRDGDKQSLVVADTPMWGKPTKLEQPRPRLKCKSCGGFAYDRSPAFHEKRNMTRRLVRYIEGAVIKRTIADVAREVALSEKQVAKIALELRDRLRKNHRFPQPDVVAMDGIKCNKQNFQIISDGRTGKPLAITRTWDADRAWKAMINVLDVRLVRVFVTDMHVTNNSLANTLREKTKHQALHVADRFHVVHACNKALSKVINDQVQALRKDGKSADANDLLALKAKIEGKRTTEEKKYQTEFDFDLPLSIKSYPEVQKAHRVRLQLTRTYNSEDRETARRQLHEWERLASDPSIQHRFEDVLRYVRNHETQVLNYFDALEPDGHGGLRGFDTSRAERRNSEIQQMWRASRGQGIELFSLRVLYHPYKFGIDIVEHDCGHFEGPFGPKRALLQANQPTTACGTCPICA